MHLCYFLLFDTAFYFVYLQANLRICVGSYHLRKDGAMRNLIIITLCGWAFAGAALAVDASCEAQATGKKLTDAAKDNFVRKCEMTAKAAATSCEGQAASKKLVGVAKNSFVRKCYENTHVPVPLNVYCESEADGKKLSGEAKSKFVKKCKKDPKSVEKKKP